MNLFQIGQNLESFLLNFDYVGPMIYPSHYAAGYLGYVSPDNHPYPVFKDAMNNAKKRIDALNASLKNLGESKKVLIQDIYEFEEIFEEERQVSYSQMRSWLQGFSCTWCKNYQPYDKKKFRDQIRAIEET